MTGSAGPRMVRANPGVLRRKVNKAKRVRVVRRRCFSCTHVKESESKSEIYSVLTIPPVNTTLCIDLNGTANRPGQAAHGLRLSLSHVSSCHMASVSLRPMCHLSHFNQTGEVATYL